MSYYYPILPWINSEIQAAAWLFTWFRVKPVCLASICLSPSVGYLDNKIIRLRSISLKSIER
jgi:hypothetical protein